MEYKDYKNILHLSPCVFWYVLFDEKLIVLHHSDNAFLFLFWHLYQTHTFSNDLNDGEMITSHLMFEQCFIKQLFMIKISYKKHATWQNHFVIAKFRKLRFFQLNLVFIADSRTGLCSGLLSKYELNVRSSHWSCSVKKVFLRILQIQNHRERGGRPPYPPPFQHHHHHHHHHYHHHFLEQNNFFPRKIGKHNIFTCEQHDRLWFIEQDIVKESR